MEVTFTLNRRLGGKGRRPNAPPRNAPPGNAPGSPQIARLSRLMALAIRFDTLIRDGSVPNQATLARLGGVTRARLTQIMQLVRLAPDIQEELLWLPGGSRMAERTIRPAVRCVAWEDQRRAFALAKGPKQN
jgi:hypothetical protein